MNEHPIERDPLDTIRDKLGDEGFADYCTGEALRRRLDKSATPDAYYPEFFEEMARHVRFPARYPDPRGDAPYVRRGVPDRVERMEVKVLDHGYIRLVEMFGYGDSRIPEAGIIEAARQSTQGSFRGWRTEERLLGYLRGNRHDTPSEFAGFVFEARMPIFVIREWHRHRTQSYNEASGRYRPLPDVNYVPSVDRLMQVARRGDGGNKQAGADAGAAVLTEARAEAYRRALVARNTSFQSGFEEALADGVPKELARLDMGLNRYTQQRLFVLARNLEHFLRLRLNPKAMWEIGEYARAALMIYRHYAPRSASIFCGSLDPEWTRPPDSLRAA